jgi:hypothetical protein
MYTLAVPPNHMHMNYVFFSSPIKICREDSGLLGDCSMTMAATQLTHFGVNMNSLLE